MDSKRVRRCGDVGAAGGGDPLRIPHRLAPAQDTSGRALDGTPNRGIPSQTRMIAAKAPSHDKPDANGAAPTAGGHQQAEQSSAPKEGTVRFRCPGGETPSVVRAGCACGSAILNPCETGGIFPSLDGDVCVFECPPKTADWEPKTEEEQCLKKCNDESGWRFMGQCQVTCEANAAPSGGWSPAAMNCAPERRAACERQAAQRKVPCKKRSFGLNAKPGDDCRSYGLCRTEGDDCVEGCDDADVASGQCARWCEAGNQTVCAWLCDRNEDERSCARLCKGGRKEACLSMCGTDQKPCNKLCRAGHMPACEYADYESTEAGKVVAERKKKAAATARLPGLFTKCESNRARIFRWKKAWIAAKRKGAWEKAQEAEQELQKLQPGWAATLGAIREAIRESTDDKGVRFQQLVKDVKRRCSLPSWAGFF